MACFSTYVIQARYINIYICIFIRRLVVLFLYSLNNNKPNVVLFIHRNVLVALLTGSGHYSNQTKAILSTFLEFEWSWVSFVQSETLYVNISLEYERG